MIGLERALVFLRQFTDSQNWEYCVVWKLGDDPSRFIEWMGCCCGGGGGGEKNQSVAICRDLYFVHKINSKACESLASFPSSLPSCSGIYGDVVASSQSKWITNSSPDSNSYSESLGTRVLIPVLGGLIELYAAKHIPKDQKIIDFIIAHCNVPKQEAMVAHCDSSLDPFLEHHLPPIQSHLLSLLWGTEIIHPLNQINNLSSLQLSSGYSHPPNDQQSLDSHNEILNCSIEKHPDHPKISKNNKTISKNQGGFRSKNLVSERKRRTRINDGIFTLRSLVPKITKMNKTATLGDAIDYILELEKEVKDIQDELKELEEQEQESKNSNTKRIIPDEINEGSASVNQTKKIEIEVNQLGIKKFLIKVSAEKEKGGFGKLIDLIYSMGLQVANVNMTTCNGQVSTVLIVEAISKEIQLKRLRESLLKLGGKVEYTSR